MHIILGDDSLDSLRERYTVLEVDQFRMSPDDDPIQAYCIIENIPLEEMAKIDEHKHLHERLMANYKKGDWNFCEQALEHLQGKWGSQMNSFYTEIATRVAKYKKQDPGETWDPVIKKY
jgi:hypothetical protein